MKGNFVSLSAEPLDFGVIRVFVIDEECAFDAALIRIQSVRRESIESGKRFEIKLTHEKADSKVRRSTCSRFTSRHFATFCEHCECK
jgi:hypothetical protein